MQIQLGAFGELLVHLVEAALRHKQCRPDLVEHIGEFLDGLTEDLAPASLAYPMANASRVQRVNLQRRFLSRKMEEARVLAEQPQAERPVAIRVLYCTKLPQIMLDTKVGAPATAAESGGPGAPFQPDSDAQSKPPAGNKKTETAYFASAPAGHRR